MREFKVLWKWKTLHVDSIVYDHICKVFRQTEEKVVGCIQLLRYST